MTDQKRQAIKLAIRRQTKVNTASSAAAQDALVRMGFYTTNGKVAPEYREAPKYAARKSVVPTRD